MAEVNQPKLRTIKKRIEENSDAIDRIVDQLVHKYNKDLDDFVTKVKNLLDNKDELTDAEVEELTLKVPIYMYYATQGLETLGIQADNAKAIKGEAFNDHYMQGEGTINDKKAWADNQVLEEALMEVAYSRAYKKLKAKMEVAVHLCNASRKVLHKRISEIDVNRLEPNYHKNNNNN